MPIRLSNFIRQSLATLSFSGPSRRRRKHKSLQSEDLETRQLLSAHTWDGGGGVPSNGWSNRFNWTGDIAPVAGDDLIFPGTAGVKVMVNDFPNSTAGNFKSITMTASNIGAGYLVSGNPIRLTGNVTINSVIGSTHEVNANIAFQGAAAHVISTGDGTTLALDRAVSSSTPISKTGTGRLLLAGSNSFTSSFSAQAGITQLAHKNALGTTAGGTTVFPGAAIELAEFVGFGEEFPRDLTVAENISLGGTGINNTGALRNVSGDNLWTGTVSLQAGLNNAIGVDAPNAEFETDQLTISGLVKDVAVAGFHKVGDGRLFLTNANTYRGTTLIDDGVIRIKNSTALGSTVGITRVQDGAALELDDVELGGGETANLVVAEPLQLLGNGVATGGALRNIEGSNTWTGSVELLAATTIATDRAGDVLGITSVITGPVASTLTKQGAGSLLLTANSTYVGKTTVQTGILEVNGNNSLSAVTVVNGTLQGTGSVGPTTIQRNGRISPAANQNGTLNVKGLSSVGTIEITVGNTSHDVINVTGKVNIGDSTILVRGNTGLTRLNIIQNDGTDGVAGTTNGSTITSVNGQSFLVNYAGNTGNDVQLVRLNTPPMLANRQITQNTIEGSEALLTATIVDPDAIDRFFMSVDWGDGDFTEHTFNPAAPRNIALSHRYDDDGDYLVRLVWTDASGNGNTGTLATTVVNAAPSFDAGGNTSVRRNSLFERQIGFADPGLDDAAFVTVDYGDGTAPQLLTPGYGREFSLRHRFARTGSWLVTVTINDGDGGVSSDSFFVTVT